MIIFVFLILIFALYILIYYYYYNNTLRKVKLTVQFDGANISVYLLVFINSVYFNIVKQFISLIALISVIFVFNCSSFSSLLILLDNILILSHIKGFSLFPNTLRNTLYPFPITQLTLISAKTARYSVMTLMYVLTL